jgi:hypothetical protein
VSEHVRQFLLEFKKAATSGSGVDLVPRRSTRPTLLKLGLTKRNVEEILLSLSVADYCKGPEGDRDRPGEVWFFGKEIEGCEVYIKLKVANVRGRAIAKCISFHFAKHPLSFPYK